MQNQYLAMWTVLDYIVDLIYIADMFVSSRTGAFVNILEKNNRFLFLELIDISGFLDQGLMVRDVYRLMAAYIQSFHFKLDLLSVLPTDIYFFFSNIRCEPEKFYPCSVFVRFNRLARFYRVSECFERIETRTTFPYVFRIGKLIFYILILIHWNACIYFAISYVIGFDSDRWVYNRRLPASHGHHGIPNGAQSYNDTQLEDPLRHQYIYCFYWSTLTLTTIGEVPTPETDFEYIFVVINFLIGQ